jgi:hypothetical protein
MKALLMILFAPLWLMLGVMIGNPMLLASWLLQPKSNDRSGRQQWEDQRTASIPTMHSGE